MPVRLQASGLAILLFTPCCKDLVLQKQKLLAKEMHRLEPFSIKNFDLPTRAARSKRHQSCDPRCAHAVVFFSMVLKSSYISIAIAPTTTSPLKARPICIDEPAEISR